MIGFFANIFGYLLDFLYKFLSNYGLAIILFSIIIKLLMLPLSIKQQKSVKKNAKIQDEMKHPIFLNVFILCLIFSNVNIEGIIGCNKSVYGQPSFYMDKIISQLL